MLSEILFPRTLLPAPCILFANNSPPVCVLPNRHATRAPFFSRDASNRTRLSSACLNMEG